MDKGHIKTDQSLCIYMHIYMFIYIFVCTSSWIFFQAVVLFVFLNVAFSCIHYMLNSFISKITLKWPNKHDSQVQITESKPNMRRSSLSRAQLLTHLCMHVCVFTSQCIHLRGHFCIFFCFI